MHPEYHRNICLSLVIGLCLTDMMKEFEKNIFTGFDKKCRRAGLRIE
jgi:hypothetical protein